MLLVVIFPYILWSKTDPNAPRYVAVQSQPVGPLGSEHYDWGAAVPFRDGKAWLFTVLNRTNHHSYLYDLDNRKVLGELFNSGIALWNQDQTKILCGGSTSLSTTVKGRLAALLSKISLGKINLHTNLVEACWILDLRNNSTHRVGELSQIPGTASRWIPSPGFRFGYNVPNNREENHSFFLCDLETGVFRQINCYGGLHNWWSDHGILFDDFSGNFLLFDVLTGKVSTLFTSAQVYKFCHEFGLTTPALTPLSNWNGSNYDFYFSGATHLGDVGRSFLLKADKTVPTVKLFAHDFELSYLGDPDAAGKHYVYNGESGPPGRGGNGGIYLRDLTNNATTTLVQPDNSGQYALPRFYKDSVIYFRNRVLWRIVLNGSNTTRLFRPQDK